MGVFMRKGLSIREKSLIDKTGLPKKVWQYYLPKNSAKKLGDYTILAYE